MTSSFKKEKFKSIVVLFLNKGGESEVIIVALPTVHIRKEAFLILVWSAIETFKKECFGFLLGHSPTEKNNFFSITDAVPFQKVKRFNTRVDLYKTVDRKFKKFVSDIGGIYPKYLGDFHSHPEWGSLLASEKMSDLDLEEFSKTAEPLEFIIRISSRKKGRMAWTALQDGSVEGSFGKFNLYLNVYTLIQEGKEIVPQKIQIVAFRAIETLNRICFKQ